MELEIQNARPQTSDPAVGSTAWLGEYTAHIKSAQWRNIRAIIIKRCGGKCERCGVVSSKLECHHKTYERFKRERMTDLEALCVPCHEKADKEREQQQRVKSAQRVYAAGLDTYMTKKYGEEWQMNHYDDTEQYDNWLERKRDDFA